MNLMQRRGPGLAVIWLAVAITMVGGHSASVRGELPTEPIEIGTAPQFLIDNYLVDNSWAIKYKRESVQRVFHPPKKFENNPVIPATGGYASVIKDERDGKFKMWY